MKGDTQRQGKLTIKGSPLPLITIGKTGRSAVTLDVNEGTLGEGVATTQAVTAVPASAGVDAL